MLDITYRDASYRPGAYGSGKLIRRTEASIGAIRRTGANRTEAKTALLEAVTEQVENCRTRRYLMGVSEEDVPVAFVLYFNDGWGYDIVRNGGKISSSTSMTAVDERDAFEKMQHHFDQYVGKD